MEKREENAGKNRQRECEKEMQKIKIENMPELPYALEEALNRLRINISFLGDNVRKIMITSTDENEGKSFVAVELWKQMAMAGADSILLDADLRKSVLAEKYKITLEGGEKLKGTSNYLAGNDSIEKVICHTDYKGSDILPNVDNVINPSLLIENGRFKQMLDYMGEKYRYIFVDSPPLGLVSDGERIGSLCDGAILVVKGGSTPKSAVRNTIRQLERSNCPLLGIVLNQVSTPKNGYYAKKYGSYYGSYYGKN